jgi:hypothetical protein
MNSAALEMLRDTIRAMREWEAADAATHERTNDRFWHGTSIAYGLTADRLEMIIRLAGEMCHVQTFDPGPENGDKQ